MKFIDDKIRELEGYMPPLTRRDDFLQFWQSNIDKSHALPLNVRKVERENSFDNIKSYDLYYDSADGATVCHGLLIIPENYNEPLPVVVLFHGFSWYCGQVHDHLQYPNMGYALLALDHRGQNGSSADRHAYKTDALEFMAKGCEDKEDYTVKWSILDGIRAIDYICDCPDFDSDMIITTGPSQGGAMSLSVACLDERVKYCFCDVPSNCNIERRIQNRNGSFNHVHEYLRRRPERMEKVYETLSYFDIMNMAEYCKAEVFASVGLEDTTCPAICFYAAYNRMTCKKHIAVYPFAEHEGGWFNYDVDKYKMMKGILNDYKAKK